MGYTPIIPSVDVSETHLEQANENWRTERFLNVASKSATFVAGADDTDGSPKDLYLCTVAAGYTIDLPAASTCTGRIFTFKKVDAAAAAFTLDGNGAETIDGAATLVGSTAQWSLVQIVSTGSAWLVLDKYL